jgi:CheY-like chemotaxis protein
MHTFLIIDDDPDDVQMFCEAVAEIDKTFHCFCAYSGEEAIKLLQHTVKPDFIFLDLNMPRMGGKECLVQIKKHSQFANIPVIVYTTSKAEKDVEETLQCGASAFLTKPNKFDKLINAIKDITQKKFPSKALRDNLHFHR